MTENKQNNNSWQTNLGLLQGLRKKVLMRAAFSVVILLLTAVLLFSMTAAWYTNVADTGGLIFTANQWGFDGNIFIENDVISMAPGDSGIVSMQITNNGDETALASVTVSKANLSDLMKKRLYFYVDTSNYRNAERMDRVYVSSSGGYAYTLFPDSEIYVTAESQNAPALKWEWVYDVLGYYVYGKITEDSVQIDEYIRPIEYAFDPVTTTFDADGYLKTIDGFKTASEFLVTLSETDGYSGTIDVSARTPNGYYPVYVNSEGFGVWAYLCTYQEIMQNIQDDTEIGTSSATQSHSVEISVTGSNSTEIATNVGDKETLTAMIESTGYVNLKLTEDITLDGELVIKNGHRADIDLNGHILKSTDDRVIYAEEGSKIVLKNGEVQGSGQSIGVEASGAEVVMNNVLVTNVKEGIKVSDHQNDAEADSRIHIVDSEIVGGRNGLWIYGNNGTSDTMTTIVVERSTITGSGYAGITCNGSYPGTNIQITDSTISGMYTSIYHPQKSSTLHIERSTLEGITGLVVKGGTVTVHNSVIRGTGTAEQITEPQYSMSGFSDTGDGIYLEANYEWEAYVTVTGAGTVVTSANAYAVRKYMAEEIDADIYLKGGRYSTDVRDYLAPGAVQTQTENGFVVTTAN